MNFYHDMLDLSKLTQEDVDLIPITNPSSTKPETEFLKLKMSMFSDFHWIKMTVFQENDFNARIITEVPQLLYAQFQNLDKFFGHRLKTSFPDCRYKSFLKDDEDLIFTMRHVGKLPMLSSLNVGGSQKLIGLKKIEEKFDGSQGYLVALNLEIMCICKRGEILSCRPRLVSVRDWPNV